MLITEKFWKVFIFCCIFSTGILSQNLVPNSSFETYTVCPTALSLAHYATPWYNANAGNTPDLFNVCGAGTFAGVPANRLGNQTARTGDGYAGVFCYYPPSGNNNTREYIGVELCDTLTGGLSYYVEFFVSLADSSQHASDDIGMYFSNTQIVGPNNLVLPYVPQINSPAGVAITNKTGWTKVSGNFVATGGEKYITIGSFKNAATVNITPAPNPGSTQPFNFYNNVYFYIDDVFVGLQQPVVSNDTNVCPGANIALTAQGGLGYSWSTGASTSGINVSPSLTTKYYVSIYGICDTVLDSVEVAITNTLSASISGTTDICDGENTTLSAAGGSSYLWNTSSTTSSINVSPTTNTVYTLTVSSGVCTDTTSVTVSVVPPPNASISDDDTICVGQSLSLSASGGSLYTWNTGATNTSISVSPTINTTYSVEVSNGVCSDFKNVNVFVRQAPTITVTPDTTMYAGNSIILAVNNATAYLWSPLYGLSCSDCRFPRASPTESTTYYVTIYDEYGCTAIDSIIVTVEQDCAEVHIPNAFSPNGDGNNDILQVYAKCVKNYHFYVYDRWGEVVFETTNLSEGWDGTFRGKELNSAVFSYLIKGLSFAGQEILLSGNLSLLR